MKFQLLILNLPLSFRMKQYILLLFGLFFFLSGKSQFDLSHKNYTTQNNLPCNRIYEIKQSNDGELLIAHDKGFSIFNGKIFTNYYTNENRNALSNIVLYKDQILLQSFRGIQFSFYNNKLIEIPSLDSSKNYFSPIINFNDKLYSKQRKSLNAVEINSTKSQNTLYTNQDIFTSEILKHKNRLYIKSAKALESFSENGVKTKSTTILNNKPSLLTAINDQVCVLHFETGELYFPEIEKTILLDAFEKNQKVNFIKQSSNKNILIGTYNGLLVYNQDFKFIGKFLSNYVLNCVFEDVENNLWFGSANDGLLKVANNDILYWNLSEKLKEKTNISNAILAKNKLVLGTFNGKIIILDNAAKIEKIIDLQNISEVQALNYNENDDELLVFCSKYYVIDFGTGKIKWSKPMHAVKASLKIGSNYYNATSAGLQITDNSGNEINRLNTNIWYSDIEAFKNGVLINGNNSIDYYDINSTEIISDFNYTEKHKPPTQNKDSVLIAVGKKILNYSFDSKTELYSLAHFVRTFTLLNNDFAYSDGSKIYLQKNENKNFIDQSNGLIITEIIKLFNWNNKLLVIGNNEIQLIENNRKHNQIKPKLLIHNISGTFAKNGNILQSKYADNQIQIDCKVYPNLSANGQSKVYYRLVGLSNKWKEIGNETFYEIIEKRLPIGKFKVEIKAENNDKIESEVQTLIIEVLSPFYKTWWFIILNILLIFSLVYFFVNQRFKVLERKNQEKLTNEKLKLDAQMAEMKALRAQMNPHFIFNCLSSIQNKILSEETTKAYEHLGVFTKLLREALTYTSKEFISLAEEVAFIEKYVQLEQLRRNNTFQFLLEIDKNIDLEEVKFPSLISQPFVENAILHGLMHQTGEQVLHYKIQYNSVTKEIQIIIEDNGIGMKKSSEINKLKRTNHQSVGTKNTQERLQILNRSNFEMNIDTIALSVGTQVIIKFKNHV